jgi:hypothetical protein
MFGGYRASERYSYRVGVHLGETWEWNGSDWTQLMPLHTPVGRSQAPFVSWQDTILMFGGQTANGIATDTWTWNGLDWVQQATAHAPEYCNSPAAAVGGKVLMFCSARTADDHEGHTWEWDGSGWHERNPKTRPSNRYGHVLASFSDRAVMYGGFADSGNAQETWVWDGDDWTDVSTVPSPPARIGYQAAQLGTELVLYGAGTNETWSWNGARWGVAAPRSMPPARRDYALVTVGERVILFGGCCKPGANNTREYWDDTWQWDGQHWTPLTAAVRPPARAFTALTALDDHAALLFGGLGASGLLDDTWLWDAQNNTWVEHTSTVRPPARQRHALAVLDNQGKVLLFGGSSAVVPTSTTPLGDTWAWERDSWQRLSPTGTLPAPAYDVALGKLGTQLLLISRDQAWAWNDTLWSPLEAAPGWWGQSEPVYVATLPTPEGERLIVASTNADNFFAAYQWDGNVWDWFPMPNDASISSFPTQPGSGRPFATLGSSLAMLTGTLQRTWIYGSR